MKTKHIIWGISILVLILLIANYQNILKAVLPPNPVIVSSKADGSSSKLFDFSVQISGEVRNEGGDGYVIVEATYEEGNNSWTKTQQLYLEAYQTSQFKIAFDEARLLDSDPKFSVRSYALGSLNK